MIIGNQGAGRLRGVAHFERIANILRRNLVRIHALGVHNHAHVVAGAAYGRHFTRTGNALQLDFRRVRHLGQIKCRALRIRRPQGKTHDRHIVNADRLDDGVLHTEVGGDPIAVRLNRVVQAHQGADAILAYFVLHRQHRHAGARYRIHVFDAGNLRQHLLGGCGDQRFYVFCRRAGERNKHIRHRHIDLRLFLARCH